jgi:predicted ribosomally synthesized peptide with nif11-like leader
MSAEKAKAFLKKAQDDQALQAKIDATQSNGKAVVKLGASLGYEFTVEELNMAIDELYGELSDEELASAAGGTTGKWTPIEFNP